MSDIPYSFLLPKISQRRSFLLSSPTRVVLKLLKVKKMIKMLHPPSPTGGVRVFTQISAKPNNAKTMLIFY
jgi:hypothetical protein